MIFETLPTNFDIQKLQQHLKDHVLSLDPVMQAPSFGGWSVLSSNQSYKDGWHMGHKVAKKESTTEQYRQDLQQMGVKNHTEYIYPTEICTGYLNEVIQHIQNLGLSPLRARIIRLTAGLSSTWHRDTPDHIDFVRLHVPIITNSGCFFETENGRDHMAANGNSYLVRVNRIHRVVNDGPEHRYHLVMDVKDTQGVSQYHRHQE